MINVNISANLCIGASSGLAAFSMGHTAERIRVAGNFLFGATRFGVDAFSSNKGTVGNELVGNVMSCTLRLPRRMPSRCISLTPMRRNGG